MPRPADSLRASDLPGVAEAWAEVTTQAAVRAHHFAGFAGVRSSIANLECEFETESSSNIGRVAQCAAELGDKMVQPVDGTFGCATGAHEAETLKSLLEALPTLFGSEGDASVSAPLLGAPSAAELTGTLSRIVDQYASRSVVAGAGGFLGYVPGGGLFASCLGEFLGVSLNRYTGASFAAPALTALEGAVVRWFCEWMGYDTDSAGGALTTGGSMATVIALLAAREDRLDSNSLPKAVIYTQENTHHCVLKSVRLIGFIGREQVRVVPASQDNLYRMDVAALERMIAQDRAIGLVPFCVVSTAGTTATGAVDPIGRIADICTREKMWHHCDAAYGGFFRLSKELAQSSLADLHRTDSIVVDPHKSLFLPYGTGAVLVRDRHTLLKANATSANYLPSDSIDHTELGYWENFNPMAQSFELTRDFRGLKVWLPLKLHGLNAFRDAIQEKRELALYASQQIVSLVSDVEGNGISWRYVIAAQPEISLFPFYLTWPGATRAQENFASERALEISNAMGKTMITGVRLNRYLLRVCVVCFRTVKAHIDELIGGLRSAAPNAIKQALAANL